MEEINFSGSRYRFVFVGFGLLSLLALLIFTTSESKKIISVGQLSGRSNSVYLGSSGRVRAPDTTDKPGGRNASFQRDVPMSKRAHVVCSQPKGRNRVRTPFVSTDLAGASSQETKSGAARLSLYC